MMMHIVVFFIIALSFLKRGQKGVKTSSFSLNFFRSVADSCVKTSLTSTPRLHIWAGSGSKHIDSCLRLKTLCLAFSSNSAVEHIDLFTRSETVRKMSLALTSTFLPFVMLFSHCAETNGNLRCVEFIVCIFQRPCNFSILGCSWIHSRG